MSIITLLYSYTLILIFSGRVVSGDLRLLLLLKNFIQFIKVTAVGNTCSRTVHRMIADV
jgi:hypothetical protein